MKRYLKPAYLPLAVLAAGVLACLFRFWLLALGTDQRGLLSVGSFPDVMSWIVTALTIVLLFVGTRPLQGSNKYGYNFPASIPAALGMALAAIGFFISSVADLSGNTDTIGTLGALFGFLAAASLLFLAYYRMQGKHLNIAFHGIVCIYLMLHLVSHYRLWSSSPQLQRYGFELLAIVFVMLSCYQKAAFDVGKGSRQIYTFFCLAAFFFCIAALPGCDNAAFFLGSAAWVYLTPCKLTLPAKKEN